MKLVIGLGNPGKQYQLTRHNAGFLFLDKLAGKLNLEFKKNKKLNLLIAKNSQLILIKPETFMNLSGIAVRAVVNYFQLGSTGSQVRKDLLLVHDDLDLRLGQYKFSFAKGPKDHHGVLSVESQLKIKDFWRLRIGINNRSLDCRQSGADYVLSRFSKTELTILNKTLNHALENAREWYANK